MKASEVQNKILTKEHKIHQLGSTGDNFDPVFSKRAMPCSIFKGNILDFNEPIFGLQIISQGIFCNFKLMW